MTDRQTITAENVRFAARRAYDQGTLLAQCVGRPVPYGYRVEVDGVEHRCAIGAALCDTTLDMLDERSMELHTLQGDAEELNKLLAWPEEDLEALVEVQKRHDTWLSMVQQGFGESDIRTQRRAFLEIIDHPAVQS